jgi:hypothetical protein
METILQSKPIPSLGESFGNGWNVMKKYFLILFLVVIVLGIIMGPTQIFRLNIDPTHHGHWDWHFSDINLIALGMFTVIFGLFALAYAFLIIPVFKYGGKMMFVQAVRDIRPDFNTLVKGFRENYLGIVLANLLSAALIMLGIIALIIPGIIIGCRLAFVGYLIMDKNLDPIMAVEESWKMTKGHGWTIFFMAIVSFFIFIAGLCLLFVGIFPALIWVSSSFASLYEAVRLEKNAE